MQLSGYSLLTPSLMTSLWVSKELRCSLLYNPAEYSVWGTTWYSKISKYKILKIKSIQLWRYSLKREGMKKNYYKNLISTHIFVIIALEISYLSKVVGCYEGYQGLGFLIFEKLHLLVQIRLKRHLQEERFNKAWRIYYQSRYVMEPGIVKW